jgi:hypothetical protein
MEPSPFCEELLLLFSDDSERFTCVRSAHVVVLPKRGRSLVIAQKNEDLSIVGGLDVDVRRLVLPRRGVYIDLESTGVVFLDLREGKTYRWVSARCFITSGCTCEPPSAAAGEPQCVMKLW